MTTYDVVVVGGGAAGLSGAVALARSRRSVVVVDAGRPRNAPAEGVHNLLGREGVSPADLLSAGRAELASYGGELMQGEAVQAAHLDDGRFEVGLVDGRVVVGRRLLVTTGLVDELPDVAGLRERWGRDVLHCPYCHGWEARDRAVAVLATGATAVHQAHLFRQLSDDVVVLAHTAQLGDAEREELAARDVRVVEGRVCAVEAGPDGLTGVRLASGEVLAREVVVVAPRFVAATGLLEQLGVQAADLLVGEHSAGRSAVAAADGSTSVPGVYVAGNVAQLQAQVAGAAAAGLMAGARINADLVAEDVREAVAARRGDGQIDRVSPALSR